MLKKSKKVLISITCFVQPNIFQTLSFQDILNIKLLMRYFYILLFSHTKSSKFGMYFTLIAYLSLD